MTAVEICVQDPVGAAVALDGGATRVELCTALALGGLTPSIGTIAAVRALTAREGWLQVLVRPRAGGYVYTPSEMALTREDVRAAVEAGADGVVIGALTPERRVHEQHVRALVEAAAGRTVTFHRALDVVADRPEAVRTLADLGVQRVLTSCGRAHAVDAAPELAELAAAAGGRLQLMAGGGVRPQDIPALAAAGCDAVHLSARRLDPDRGGEGGDGSVWRTDPAVVRAAVASARQRLSR